MYLEAFLLEQKTQRLQSVGKRKRSAQKQPLIVFKNHMVSDGNFQRVNTKIIIASSKSMHR